MTHLGSKEPPVNPQLFKQTFEALEEEKKAHARTQAKLDELLGSLAESTLQVVRLEEKVEDLQRKNERIRNALNTVADDAASKRLQAAWFKSEDSSEAMKHFEEESKELAKSFLQAIALSKRTG